MITLKENNRNYTTLYYISTHHQDRTQKATISITSTSIIIEYCGDCTVKSVHYGYVNRINVVILYNSYIEYDITSYSL